MNSIAYRIPPNEVAGSATDLRESPSGSPPAFCKIKDGFAVRSGHLAPPVQTPDSPRPQKNAAAEPFAATLTVPAGTAAGSSSTKQPSASTADGK